jgi:outer membrane protein OmpA-like peptidoglycan-associated protein
MKKKLLIILAASIGLSASASVAKVNADSLSKVCGYDEAMLQPIAPTYLTDVMQESGWRDNWFLNISGGVDAFIGSPMGCDDLFGRIRPTFSAQIGKWFTPRVGARIAYQGMWFKDCESMSQQYHQAHADLMWNPMGRNYNARDRPFDIVPYAGVGLLHHRSNGNNSFALSYGLIGRYRLAQRIHLTMELGGTTTFKNFDGYGDSRELGDHLLSFTAGISITIGRAGWKHVVDARPYITQNEWMHGYIARLSAAESNADTVSSYYAKNDYSGLNSLMQRLHGNGGGADKNNHSASADELAKLFSDGKYIGCPIYVFFKLGTANLTDESQQINIDAIAKAAKQYGLVVRVYGAADSATGNAEINNKLSADRARYICSQLKQRGVPDSHISLSSEGGVDDYSPTEANRNTRIELHFK